MPNLLRARDLNVQKKHEVISNFKSIVTGHKSIVDDEKNGLTRVSANKHKSIDDDENDGPPRPKRVALSGITETLSSTLLDSSKKQLSLVPAFDFDKENACDPFGVSEFANDIFKYFKHREQSFTVENYFDAQKKNFGRKERAASVDWLVQMQETFELNHETLYMAVKLMDLYMAKVQSQHSVKSIQLVPCTAIFIASKFEERSAPSIDDLVYLCNKDFDGEQLKQMERKMLCVVGFDLGFPLSYSFLRRYGRVIKASLPLLTVARYCLELSLHYLKFCLISESKMAAACMLLALRVTKTGDWNDILETYSGYKLVDIEQLAFEINHMVCRFPIEYKDLRCVKEKYSHDVFYRVAAKPVLPDRIRGSVEH